MSSNSTISSAIPNFTGQIIDSDHGRLRLVEAIGEGAHGVVYRAVEEITTTSSSSPSPKVYAVKVQLRAKISTSEGRAQAREIVTHKIASCHPKVVTLHQVIEDDYFLFLITDYCPGGDLLTAVIDDHKYARKDGMVKSAFLQLLDAVESIHEQSIYHRDIKPENVFLNEDATQLYLGDFGLATDVDEGKGFGCGSITYMSPECIGHEFNFRTFNTAKSDIWALGVILINMLTGRNPWRNATTDDYHFTQYLADNNWFRTVFPISVAASEVLKRILSFNPEQRISIADLREEIKAIDTFFMTDEEIANSPKTVKDTAAIYFPRTPTESKQQLEPTESTSSEADGQAAGASGYPSILPEDAHVVIVPAGGPAPPSALLTESRVFTIGSVSDGTVSPSSGSQTESSGAESSGPLTPEVHAEDDKGLVSPEALEELALPLRAAETQKGPMPIHCLVQGIEDIQDQIAEFVIG